MSDNNSPSVKYLVVYIIKIDRSVEYLSTHEVNYRFQISNVSVANSIIPVVVKCNITKHKKIDESFKTVMISKGTWFHHCGQQIKSFQFKFLIS